MNGIDRAQKHDRATPLMCTIKIRFTAPQIAFLRRAHPDCNLDGLVELTFVFDQDGHLIDCTGKVEGTTPSGTMPASASSSHTRWPVAVLPVGPRSPHRSSNFQEDQMRKVFTIKQRNLYPSKG